FNVRRTRSVTRTSGPGRLLRALIRRLDALAPREVVVVDVILLVGSTVGADVDAVVVLTDEHEPAVEDRDRVADVPVMDVDVLADDAGLHDPPRGRRRGRLRATVAAVDLRRSFEQVVPVLNEEEPSVVVAAYERDRLGDVVAVEIVGPPVDHVQVRGPEPRLDRVHEGGGTASANTSGTSICRG